MKKLVLAVLLVAAAAPARATSTSRLLGLDIIPVGTLSWGPRDNNRIYQISSAAASQYDSNTFGLNGSTQTSRGAWLFNNGSSITFATGSAFYLAPATAYASTITAAGIAEAYGVTASTMGIGGSPSGTRKFQVYFNANNNSPSYGDGAVRYLDSVNGVGFECGALYGGSQPSWCQSGNDGMGTKKPFVFQPDGSNVGIRTLSPATTAALEVAGPVSVGGSGNTQYSLQASSGASFGSDLHVTGTLEATKLKGDGSQLTGIGGGGTVTTQGSPAAGYMAAFQGSSAISTAPYYVTPDSMTALVPVSFSTGVNIAQYAKFSSSAPSASMGAGAMWLDSSSGRINYLDANNLQIELDPAVVFATTYSTGTVTRAIGPPSNDKLCFTPGHHSFSDGTPGLGCADALGGLPFGISGTVKRLTCWHSSALGASNTWTLRKNGSSTGNACTDSAIAASCSVSESLVIVSTDIVSVQQTAGATLTNGGCMIAVVPGVQ
jgi:hypothetical protein